MAEKEVKVSYGALKLQALSYYMSQEDTSVETALKEHLDKLYQKVVPKQVQEFLEKGPLDTDAVPEQGESQQAPEGQPEASSETVSGTGAEQETVQSATPRGTVRGTAGRDTNRASARTQGSTGRSNRNSQRQSEAEQTPATEETADTVTPEEADQEETGGMAMSM